MIHKGAIVYPHVELGENVEIFPGAIVGAPAEVKGQPQQIHGAVVIGSGTVIRENVTIHSPRSGKGLTVIGENCYIQAHAHVGHDAFVDDNVTLACHSVVAGHVLVGRHSNLGLHAVTHQRAVLHEGTFLGAGAFFKGESKAWGVYVGVPAKWIKWNNRLRQKLGLNDLG